MSISRSLSHSPAVREMLLWLEQMSVQELRALSERYQLSRTGKRKSELVDGLLPLLSDKESIFATLARLPIAAQALLELVYLLAEEDGLTERELLRALLAWYGPAMARGQKAALDQLCDQGLLFLVDSPTPTKYQLPQIVRACLGPTTKDLAAYDSDRLAIAAIEESAPNAIPETVESLCLRFQQEHDAISAALEARLASGAAAPHGTGTSASDKLLDAAAAGRTPESALGDALYVSFELGERDERRIGLAAAAALGKPDDEMIPFLVELMLELGLVTLAPDGLFVNDLALERYQSQSESRRLQALLTTWLAQRSVQDLGRTLGRWPELMIKRHIRARDLSADLISGDLGVLRRFLTRLIGLLQADTWYEIDSLLDAIHEIWSVLPLSNMGTSGDPRWMPFDPALPARATATQAWSSTYGRIVQSMLRPLAWLSCIRVAFVDNIPEAISITGIGRFLLGQHARTGAQTEDLRPLTVGDDLSVRVQLGRVDADVHDRLSRFAELVEAESDLFRYRITPHQLSVAVESGIQLDEIVTFLEQISGSAMPSMAQERISRWFKSYGSVRLYQGLTAIEFADDFALNELLKTTSLERAIIHRLSPRLVVIDPAAVDGLVDEMQRKGFTPKLEEASS
jgi:hypothetical protein